MKPVPQRATLNDEGRGGVPPPPTIVASRRSPNDVPAPATVSQLQTSELKAIALTGRQPRLTIRTSSAHPPLPLRSPFRSPLIVSSDFCCSRTKPSSLLLTNETQLEAAISEIGPQPIAGASPVDGASPLAVASPLAGASTLAAAALVFYIQVWFFSISFPVSYPFSGGVSKFSKLLAVSELLNWKSDFNISEAAYNHVLMMIKRMLPPSEKLVGNFYETKKILKKIRLPDKKIHACKNHCMLYYGSDSNLTRCRVCGHDRYKSDRLSPVPCLMYVQLSMIIPGKKSPGQNLDVFLRPLRDELKMLYNDGVAIYDASRRENFNMRAMLLWTVSDFPAYAMLSGWSTHGKLACPYCMDKSGSFTLKHGGKATWKLGSIKIKIKNQAKVDGSIVETHLIGEVSMFCSQYFKSTIETQLNRESRNFASYIPSYSRMLESIIEAKWSTTQFPNTVVVPFPFLIIGLYCCNRKFFHCAYHRQISDGLATESSFILQQISDRLLTDQRRI
ncbi:hypothetical protein LXL04_002361 [Taraxacum kok-saghyz]